MTFLITKLVRKGIQHKNYERRKKVRRTEREEHILNWKLTTKEMGSGFKMISQLGLEEWAENGR